MTTEISPVPIPLVPASKEGGLLDLHNRLKEEQDNAVILDATDLGDAFPSLLMQTILCAERDWHRRDIEFSVSNLSEETNQTFCLLGLDEHHFKPKEVS